ncbi:MAG: hypothetical protein AAF639_01810 [Chloroflexota bacterium]
MQQHSQTRYVRWRRLALFVTCVYLALFTHVTLAQAYIPYELTEDEPTQDEPVWEVIFHEDVDRLAATSWSAKDTTPDNGHTCYWGVDTRYRAHNSQYSFWVAGDGADAVTPDRFFVPHNLNSFLSTTVPLDFSDAEQAKLEFYMYMDTEPDVDTIYIGASTNNENWQGKTYSGRSDGWQLYTLDLVEFLSEPEVYFVWYYTSNESNADGAEYEGVWIDDITVSIVRSAEASTEEPAETPVETPTETPTETPIETPVEEIPETPAPSTGNETTTYWVYMPMILK